MKRTLLFSSSVMSLVSSSTKYDCFKTTTAYGDPPAKEDIIVSDYDKLKLLGNIEDYSLAAFLTCWSGNKGSEKLSGVRLAVSKNKIAVPDTYSASDI